MFGNAILYHLFYLAKVLINVLLSVWSVPDGAPSCVGRIYKAGPAVLVYGVGFFLASQVSVISLGWSMICLNLFPLLGWNPMMYRA